MTGLFGKSSKNATPTVGQKLKELRKLVKEKKYDMALKVGNDILLKSPHHQDVTFIVGGIYYMRGQYKSAISFFEKSLDIGQYDTEVLLLKANAHYNLEQIKDSITCCKKIQEIDPKNKSVIELLEKIKNRKQNLDF